MKAFLDDLYALRNPLKASSALGLHSSVAKAATERETVLGFNRSAAALNLQNAITSF